MTTNTDATTWVEEAEDCLRRIAAGEPDMQARASYLASIRPDVPTVSIATVTALRQVFEENSDQADALCGRAYSEPDVPAPDSFAESEEYGAAQAWGEAAGMIRRVLGQPDGEPFNRSAALDLAGELLRIVVRASDEDEIVHTVAADALTVLGDLTEEGSSPVDLLDAARRLVDAATDGRSAAVGSLIVWVERDNGQVALEAREVARAVNVLYGDARRVR